MNFGYLLVVATSQEHNYAQMAYALYTYAKDDIIHLAFICK